MLNGVNLRLDELQTVLDQTLNLRRNLLTNASLSVSTWFCKVKKMKAIYHILNMFRHDQKSVIAECWLPVNQSERIKHVLDSETVQKNLQFLLSSIESNVFFKL